MTLERAAEMLPCRCVAIHEMPLPNGQHYYTCPAHYAPAVAAALAEKDAEIERARKAVPDDFLLQSARAMMELRAEAAALRQRVSELEQQNMDEHALWSESNREQNKRIAELELEVSLVRVTVANERQAARVEGLREALGRLKQSFSREAAISAIEAEIAALERGKVTDD